MTSVGLIVICKHSSDSFGSHDLSAASIPEKAGGGGRVEGEVGAAADKLSKNFQKLSQSVSPFHC